MASTAWIMGLNVTKKHFYQHVCQEFYLLSHRGEIHGVFDNITIVWHLRLVNRLDEYLTSISGPQQVHQLAQETRQRAKLKLQRQRFPVPNSKQLHEQRAQLR